MKLIKATIIVIILSTNVYADGWNFNIMGINPKDFENRKWYVIAAGAIASLAIHEIGHLASAKIMGTDPYFDWSEFVAYAGNGYEDLSNDQKSLYHGAGFLFQTVVGGALTAVPKTRHLDFTFGFNAFSSVNGFYYGITGGSKEDSSDVKNLDKYGYNGTAIALTSGIINGVFTHISLNKDR